MIKNILFDFDGVILDSVNAKAEAFYELYLPYGEEIAKKVVKHHKENGGVSRFEKIPYYHKTFLNEKLTKNDVEKVCNKFSKIVFEKVINSPKVEGIEEFLENHYTKMKFWVISATPTEEIRRIVNSIGFSKYFNNVYGSPEKKTFWIENILKENSLVRTETVVIGDSLNDYIAARKCDIKFIFREYSENKSIFKENHKVKFRIKSFLEFNKEIDDI